MDGKTIAEQLDACKEKLEKLLKRVEYNQCRSQKSKQEKVKVNISRHQEECSLKSKQCCIMRQKGLGEKQKGNKFFNLLS